MHDLLFNTSEIENSYKFLDFIEEAPHLKQQISGELDKRSDNITNSVAISDELDKLYSLIPDQSD
ncbi:hypothetical protein FC35_GL000797 [Limosilactobacillus coleohominis DSM 14060]|nr:hypothetical protein FC35_GL000797 [Limosilactobacillus coleohominis DSM 14060]